MPAILLDTNAISDLVREHPLVSSRVRNYGDMVFTSVIVVGEIEFGLSRLPNGKKRTELELRMRAALSQLKPEPITESVARTYGELKADLESQGIVTAENDLWIAATVIDKGHILISRDASFSRIAGLPLVDFTISSD